MRPDRGGPEEGDTDINVDIEVSCEVPEGTSEDMAGLESMFLCLDSTRWNETGARPRPAPARPAWGVLYGA